MLFLLLLPLFASAQIKIKGRISTNNQQEQVIGANVYFHELKKGAITGLDGSYEIANLPKGIKVDRISRGTKKYWRVRLGKKFCGRMGYPPKYHETLKEARKYIFGEAQNERNEPYRLRYEIFLWRKNHSVFSKHSRQNNLRCRRTTRIFQKQTCAGDS